MKRTALFALILVVLMLSACAPKRATSPSVEPMLSVPQAYEERVSDGVPAPMPTAAVPLQSAGQADYAQAPAQERLVVRNADLALVVTNPVASMEQIAAMAERMGGFVVTSKVYRTTTASGARVPQASISIRVPAGRLTEALSQIKAGAVEVTSENVYGQDVTQQYVDLQSRLRNLQLAEQQLAEIMDRATETEDVIHVFNQLTYYREQIEIVKGQMQYYEQAAALSAISVQLIAEETVEPIQVGRWKPEGVARDALQTLVNFFKGFVNFLIWMVLFVLPALILMALPVWGVVVLIRALVRRSRKARTPK